MIVGTSTSRMALPLLLPLLPLLPLLLPTRVDAVWYSEVCPTHMRYKVRVDPDTGGVVQVTHPGAFVHKQTRPQPSREGTVHWEGNSHSNSNGNASNEPAPPPPPPPQDPNNNGRTLRSNRVWRDPGDSETDALVVGGAYDNEYEYERSSSSFSFARRVLETFRRIDIGVDIDTEWLLPRSLLGDENPHDFGVLQEGEFFVKPCLCESTRWTFPQPEEGNNETNGNNETIDDLRSDPGNWGQYPNGLYAYVPPGAASKRDEWDDLPLYLCNERAVYCGVPANSDDGSSTNAAYEHNHNGNHNAVKCYDQNMRHVIARNAWPLILLWYFGLAVICCCTVHGRTAGDYVWDRATHWFQKVLCFGGGTSGGSGTSSGGGDAGTSGGNTHTAGDANEPTASTQRAHYDFNDRMLRRMIDDNDGEWGRRRTQPQDTNNNNNTNARGRPWFYSSQRRLFERSLLAQVQWIWRHQEYLRELERREMGLPPPQIKLRVKRFNSETTPSKNGDGGGYGVGTGQPGQRGGCGVAANAGASDGAANSDSDSDSNSDSNSNSNSNSNTMQSSTVVKAVSPMVKQSYKLLHKTRLSSDSFLLRYGLPEGRSILGLDPTLPTCIKVEFVDELLGPTKSKPINKSYSPVTHPNQKDHFDLVVKSYPYQEGGGGGVGAYLCDMAVGDSIQASLKKERSMHGGSAVLGRGWKQVGLVAGGTGIAPLLQIARILLEGNGDDSKREQQRPRIHLLFFNHTPEDILGREAIEALAAEHPDHFFVTYSFTRDAENEKADKNDEAQRQGTARFLKGRGDVAMARAALPPPSSSLSTTHDEKDGDTTLATPLQSDTMVFVCGRDGFVAHWAGPVARAPPKADGSKGPKIQGPLLGVLAEAGYTADQVFKY